MAEVGSSTSTSNAYSASRWVTRNGQRVYEAAGYSGDADNNIESDYDEDWYEIHLDGGGRYTVNLWGSYSDDSLTLSDTYLRGIYDSDGYLLSGTSNDDSNGTLQSEVTFRVSGSAAGQTFYISAGAFSSNTGTYRLEITETQAAPTGPDEDIGSDTSTAQALMLLGGSATFVSDIDPAYDQDWYRVTLNANERYQIDLFGTASNPTGDLTLGDTYFRGIYDTAGDFIYGTTDDDSGNGMESQVFFTPQETGYYYLAAGAFSGNTGTYQLSISTDNLSPIVVNSIEDFGNRNVTVGQQGWSLSVAGVFADPDRRPAAELELSATLADGSELPSWLHFDADTGLFSGTPTSSDRGAIQVTVTASDTLDSASDTFTIGITDSDDYRNSYADSSTALGSIPLSAGYNIGGHDIGGYDIGTIERAFDQDVFAVTLEEGQTYQFNLSGYWSHPTGDDSLTLSDTCIFGIYDSNGAYIDNTTNDDYDGVESQVTYTASTNGTYYVSAGAFYNHVGTYRLDVAQISNPPVGQAIFVNNVIADRTAFYDRLFQYQIPTSTFINPENIDSDSHNNETISYRATVVSSSNWLIDDNSSLSYYGLTFSSRTCSIMGVPTHNFSSPGIQGGDITVRITASDGQWSTYDDFRIAVRYDDHTANIATTGMILPGNDSAAVYMTSGAHQGSSEGAIELAGDVDWYAVTLNGGTVYRFNLEGDPTLSLEEGAETADGYYCPDTLIQGIYNSRGELVAGTRDDDSGNSTNAQVTFTPAADGLYYVAAAAYGNYTGAYRLSVSDDATDLPPRVLSQISAVTVDGRAAYDNTGTTSSFRFQLDRTNFVDPENSALTFEAFLDDNGIMTALPSWLAFNASTLTFTEQASGSGSGRVQMPTDADTLSIHIRATDVPNDYTSDDQIGSDGLAVVSNGAHVRIENTLASFDLTVRQGDDFRQTVSTTGAVTLGDPDIGGVRTGTVNGAIERIGDVDWFRISLIASQNYNIHLSGREASEASGLGELGDTYLYGVYTAAGTLVAGTMNDDSIDASTGAVSLDSDFDFRATTAGTYYIAAGAYGSNTGNYTVTVVTQNNQAPITVGAMPDQTVITGRAFSYAFDAGLFRDPEGQSLTYSARILNDNSTTSGLASWLSFNATTRQFSGTLPYGTNASTLRIQVTATDPGTGASHENPLSVSTILNLNTIVDDYAAAVHATVTPTGTVVMENGTEATVDATHTPQSSTGNIEFAGDVDWFRVALVGGQLYRITLQGTSSGMGSLDNPYLYGLRRANGDAIVNTSNDNYYDVVHNQSTLDSQILYRATGTGTANYYIAAGAAGTSSGTYRVNVEHVTTNSAPELAFHIPDQAVLEGRAYSFIVAGDTFVDPENNPMTYSAEWSSNGTNFFSVPSSGTGGSTWLRFNATTRTFSGTVAVDSPDIVVRVNVRDTYLGAIPENATNSTTFRITTPRDDYLATTATTGLITLSGVAAAVGSSGPSSGSTGSASGTIEQAGDIDWFKIRLTGGRDYRIALTGASSGQGTLGDPYLRGIYTSTGALVANSANNDADDVLDSEIVFRPATGGYYFIAAGAADTSTGTYRLRVTETPNLAPVVSTRIEDQTALEGRLFVYEIPVNAFRDPESGNLVYDAVLATPRSIGLTSWLFFDPDGGIGPDIDNSGSPVVHTRPYFYGTAPAGVGDVPIRITATDEGGLSVSQDFMINTAAPDDYRSHLAAADGDRSPLGAVRVGSRTTGAIERMDDSDWFAVTLTSDSTYLISVSAASSNGGTLGDPSLDGIYDSSGVLVSNTSDDDSGSGRDAQKEFRATSTGTYYIAAGATGGGTGSYTVSVTQSNTNQAPVVSTRIADQVATEGQAFYFQLPRNTFTDPEGRALTLSAELTTGAALPTWLRFDARSGTFTGTPPARTADLNVRVKARDPAGLLAADDFILTTPVAAPSASATWTVMVYVDADNNLEQFALSDLNEMEAATFSSNVNVVVQADRASGYSTADGNWTDTRRGRITADRDTNHVSSSLASIGEVDMGSVNTLTNFINWSAENYRASNYALVLWDHGNGLYGVCFDDTSGSHLSLNDVRTAIANSNVPHLNVLGFDACLMGMTEINGSLTSAADYVVDSQELVPGNGWDYRAWLNTLSNANTTARSLATAAATTYRTAYSQPGQHVTMSVTDSAAMDTLTNALSSFIDTVETRASLNGDWQKIMEARLDALVNPNDTDYRDLGGFFSSISTRANDSQIRQAATAVSRALTSTVVSNQTFGAAGRNGLNIYLPDPESTPMASYNPTNYAVLNAVPWDRFLADVHAHAA